MQATQRARVLQAALLLAAIAILAPQHAAAQNPVYSVIYSFKGGDDGASPHAGLIQSKMARSTARHIPEARAA